jgi:hypothetical protein
MGGDLSGRFRGGAALTNRHIDSPAIENEWEQIQDRIEEPWDDAPAR